MERGTNQAIGLPIAQYEERPGILDLGWGHPRPDLLPLDDWRAATEEALRTYGWAALGYGSDPGPGPLLTWIDVHARDSGDRGGTPEETFVTAGASHGLALISAVAAEPGDVVLVDSPTYHLAFPIFRDRGVEVAGVPADDDGLDPAGVADTVARLRRRGRRVSLLYTVPTFGNPTGRSMPAQRRREIVDVARRSGLTIVEDDTYREMTYGNAAPPSLWSIADGRSVVRVGSFAKTVAPGLRLGWLHGEPELIRRIRTLGYVHSGGGVNHTAAVTMATFGASGGYGRHLAWVRTEYARQRDALIDGLRTSGAELAVDEPAGGWFVWLRLPAAVDARDLLPAAENNGVSFVPGPAFYANGDAGHDRVRLSFSLLAEEDLREAAHRLGAAICTAADR
jgi:2-aminoadipate transaminase